MLRDSRTDIAKVVHTIRKAAQRGSCLSAKMLLKAAHDEHLLPSTIERRLVSTLDRCYSHR